MSQLDETDESIAALRAAHGREAPTDPRWEALSLGTLSPDEAEALRRESPEQFEIYRPFDEDESGRIARRVEERLAAARPQARPARRWAPAWAGAAVAMAAGAALFLSLRHHPMELAWSEPRGGKLGTAHLSSDPSDVYPKVLSEVIVPVHVEGDIAVRGALLVRADKPASQLAYDWGLPAKPNAENEIVISGTRGELFPGAGSGEWDMMVVVGRPGPPLSESDLRRLADRGSDADYQVLRKPVKLEGPCVGTQERPCRSDAGR
jgi:hypothetical protein